MHHFYTRFYVKTVLIYDISTRRYLLSRGVFPTLCFTCHAVQQQLVSMESWIHPLFFKLNLFASDVEVSNNLCFAHCSLRHVILRGCVVSDL